MELLQQMKDILANTTDQNVKMTLCAVLLLIENNTQTNDQLIQSKTETIKVLQGALESKDDERRLTGHYI